MGAVAGGDLEPGCTAQGGGHDILSARAERVGIPLHAVIQVTARCNYRCAHCYEVHTDGDGELTLAEIDRILGEFAALGTLYLGYTGGEFFTRRDADDLLRCARSHGFLVRLLTTGYHVDERRADLIRDLAIFEVHMSLYGPTAEIHEKVTRKPGSFARTVAAADRLRVRGVPVHLKAPLLAVNADHVGELQDLARAHGCEVHVDPKVTSREDGDLAPISLRASDAQTMRFYDQQIVPSWHAVPASLADSSCSAGQLSIQVNPMGLVFPCSSIPIPCGDLRRQSVAEVWRESAFLGTVRGLAWDKIEPCRSCDVRGYCSRCHAMAMLEDGDLLGKSSEACRHAVILRDRLRAAGRVPDNHRAQPPQGRRGRKGALPLESAYARPVPKGARRVAGLRVVA